MNQLVESLRKFRHPSLGAAWMKTERSSTKVVYERDCSYDEPEQDRVGKRIIVTGTEDGYQAEVTVKTEDDQHNYTLVEYNRQNARIEKFGDDPETDMNEIRDYDKAIRVLKDCLWDEMRHGSERYKYT